MIDKECNPMMTYAKGHGLECNDFIGQSNAESVRLPITQVLKGECQDAVFEACIANYYHCKDIVQWLIHCLELPDSSNILQQAMLIQLMAREMIAQLRVGTIFFVSVIIPM